MRTKQRIKNQETGKPDLISVHRRSEVTPIKYVKLEMVIKGKRFVKNIPDYLIEHELRRYREHSPAIS